MMQMTKPFPAGLEIMSVLIGAAKGSDWAIDSTWHRLSSERTV
jgi:hypothetical protein